MLTTDSVVFIGGVLLIGAVVGLTAAGLMWLATHPREDAGDEDDDPWWLNERDNDG